MILLNLFITFYIKHIKVPSGDHNVENSVLNFSITDVSALRHYMYIHYIFQEKITVHHETSTSLVNVWWWHHSWLSRWSVIHYVRNKILEKNLDSLAPPTAYNAILKNPTLDFQTANQSQEECLTIVCLIWKLWSYQIVVICYTALRVIFVHILTFSLSSVFRLISTAALT